MGSTCSCSQSSDIIDAINKDKDSNRFRLVNVRPLRIIPGLETEHNNTPLDTNRSAVFVSHTSYSHSKARFDDNSPMTEDSLFRMDRELDKVLEALEECGLN